MIPFALGAILVASSARALPAPIRSADGGPLGTVFVPGGRTKVGLEASELERMVVFDAEARAYAGALSAETPRFEVDVPGFWLQATEVTNEQYAVFVKRTGARPPETWGAARIAVGRARHLELETQRRAQAEQEGRPPSEPVRFDARAFWIAHWNDPDLPAPVFEIPPGDGPLPVVFVSWYEARNYARWAGLRLPSEIEFQRAARGDTTRLYPWGNEWEDGRFAATSLRESRSGASPVASFPLGTSRQGAFDLAGNVWEWTASPYIPFPGYERRVIHVGYGAARHPVNAIADFDGEQRVVVGGSFQNGRLMARATTRRAADRTQATDALGFRCAASLRPGHDAAVDLLEEVLTPNVRARDARGMVEYATESTTCVEGWSVVEAGRGAPGTEGAWTPPPGYAVIAGYQRVLFTPVRRVPANDPGGLERLGASEGLVALGFLSTSLAAIEPELPAGTYQVLWRPKGPRSAAATGGAGSDETPLEELLRLDASLDHLVFVDARGQPSLAVPVRIAWETQRESRATWLEPEAAPRTGEETLPEGSRILRFDLCVPSSSGQRGFRFELQLRLAPDELNVSWRPR